MSVCVFVENIDFRVGFRRQRRTYCVGCALAYVCVCVCDILRRIKLDFFFFLFKIFRVFSSSKTYRSTELWQLNRWGKSILKKIAVRTCNTNLQGTLLDSSNNSGVLYHTRIRGGTTYAVMGTLFFNIAFKGTCSKLIVIETGYSLGVHWAQFTDWKAPWVTLKRRYGTVRRGAIVALQINFLYFPGWFYSNKTEKNTKRY